VAGRSPAPTLKLKRSVISEKFVREIDELFARES